MIDICTSAALRELTTPALLAVLMPVVVGFGLGKFAQILEKDAKQLKEGKKDKKGNKIEGIKVNGPPELKVGKED